MDIDEFEKSREPKAKRSRMEPFITQIFELRDRGYANLQISEWLEVNGLKVTQEGVRKFIKSREGKKAISRSASKPSSATVQPAPFKQPDESSGNEVIDYAALAAGLKTETTNNGFMKMPGEPEIQTGKAGAKTK